MVIRHISTLPRMLRLSSIIAVFATSLVVVPAASLFAQTDQAGFSDGNDGRGNVGTQKAGDSGEQSKPDDKNVPASKADASDAEESEPEVDYKSLSPVEWRKRLTAAEFRVLRQHATENAFTGRYHRYKKDGVYVCAGCGLPLFDSKAKFDSGTGWPSFFMPLDLENLGSEIDRSNPREVRLEVHCSRCGGHLGHVFNDGPAPTGQRFCINSVSLKFKDRDDVEQAEKPKASTPAAR